MKAIQTSCVTEEYRSVTAYVLQIGGVWHRLTHTKTPVLDGRRACSSSVNKWDLLGHEHSFVMEACETPEDELPELVEESIRRCLESGKLSIVFMQQAENGYYPIHEYPGHTWGWDGGKLRDVYVF